MLNGRQLFESFLGEILIRFLVMSVCVKATRFGLRIKTCLLLFPNLSFWNKLVLKLSGSSHEYIACSLTISPNIPVVLLSTPLNLYPGRWGEGSKYFIIIMDCILYSFATIFFTRAGHHTLYTITFCYHCYNKLFCLGYDIVDYPFHLSYIFCT